MYAAFLEKLASIGFRDRLENMGVIPKKQWVEYSLRTGAPIPKPNDAVFDAIANRHVCPDCGGDKFTTGPSGGMSQNIKCSNLECGSEFCVAPFEDGWLGEPMFVKRTNRSEADSVTFYGRGYGKLHPTAVA